MKVSPVFAARMSGWLARLHPPSPPTATESRHLLTLLQGSMKKKLDSEHPHPADTASDKHVIPVDRLNTSRQAAAAHFASVLHNPLLEDNRTPNNKNDLVSRLEQVLAEARPDFTKIVNLSVALTKQFRGRYATMQESHFTKRLHNWLLSTSTEEQKRFFLDGRTRDAVTAVLLLERNETVLWSWLQVVYERDNVSRTLRSPRWLLVEDHFVSTLMQIAIRRHDLNEAAAQFNEAVAYKLRSGRVRGEFDGSGLPGRRLAAAIIFHRQEHNIDACLFETAMKNLPQWQDSHHANVAFCALYDPLRPSTEMLHSHLNDAESLVHFHDAQKNHWRTRKITMIALLDAAKLCLDQGKRTQAGFFLDFATNNYPDFLPPRQDDAAIEPHLELSFNLAAG